MKRIIKLKAKNLAHKHFKEKRRNSRPKPKLSHRHDSKLTTFFEKMSH